MNIAIPEGWYKLKRGVPIFIDDVYWNYNIKSWEHVKEFGDYHQKNKYKTAIRRIVENKELELMLRYFPNQPWTFNRYNNKKSLLIAMILWRAGAKSVKYSAHYVCGEKKPENLQIGASLETQYVLHPVTNGQNLLWFLLRKMDVGFSGGANVDKNFAQASWHGGDSLISEIISYFNALKEEFGVNS